MHPGPHEPRAGLVLRTKLGDLEAGALDQPWDVAAEVTAPEEPPLHGVEPTLPPGDSGVGSEPVLEEVERRPRPQDASYL